MCAPAVCGLICTDKVVQIGFAVHIRIFLSALCFPCALVLPASFSGFIQSFIVLHSRGNVNFHVITSLQFPTPPNPPEKIGCRI